MSFCIKQKVTELAKLILSGRARYIQSVLLGIAALLFLYLVFDRLTPIYIQFPSDISFSFAVAKSILEGNNVLLGPPSHVGGRHLGPVYYWFTAFGLLLSGGHEYGAILVGVGYALIGVILTLLLVMQLSAFKDRLVAAMGSLLCFCGEIYLMQVREVWHGNFIILPAACLLLSFYLCLRRGWPYFVLFVLCSSFLVITHYGCAPLAVGSGLVLMFRLLQGGVTQSKTINSGFRICVIILPAILTLLLWLPLAIYELNYPSNLLALLDAFSKPTHHPAGVVNAISTFLGFMNHHMFLTEHSQRHGQVVPMASLVLSGFWALLGCIVLFSYLRVNIKEKGLFFLGVFISIVLYILAAARAPIGPSGQPPIYEYYFNGLLPLPALFVGLIFGYACGVIKSLVFYLKERRLSWRTLAMVLPSSLFVVLYPLYAVPQVTELSFINSMNMAYRFHTLEQASCVAQQIKSDLKATEYASFYVDSESVWMRDSYLYFMGPSYWGEMDVYGKGSDSLSSYFKELDGYFTHRSENSQLIRYVVSCPYNNTVRIKTMHTQLSDGYVEDYDIHSPLKSCTQCRISRLKSN